MVRTSVLRRIWRTRSVIDLHKMADCHLMQYVANPMESLVMENVVQFASLLTGASSIIIAIFAIWISKSAERESRSNYEKTKDVLAEIDKKAVIIERTVTDNQQQLLNTVTTILRETVTPQKVDMEEQVGLAFMQTLLSNPQQGAEIIASLQPLMEQSGNQPSQRARKRTK